EHAAERRHHPPGGVMGASWLDLALLEERQLFPKEEFSAARARRECVARKVRTRSATTEKIVRKPCAKVRISRKPDMNAQDDGLQNVTAWRFSVRMNFCGAQRFGRRLHGDWRGRHLLGGDLLHNGGPCTSIVFDFESDPHTLRSFGSPHRPSPA